MTSTLARSMWWLIGTALLVLPLLPVAVWVRAPDLGPNWGDHMSAWSIGIVVVALGGLVGGRVGVRLDPQTRWPSRSHVPILLVLTVLLLGLSALAMRDAFAGNPHLIDEVAQLFQARVFSSGRLAAPNPAFPEFFLITQTMITDAGWVAQYPPGQAALLALGMWFHAEWLVNPLLGATCVVLVYIVAQRLFNRATALVAAVLWTTSAWVLFTSATYMNHVGAVTLALAGWAVAIGPRQPRAGHFLAAGVLLAAATMTRPLDGAAAAVPLIAWMVLRRQRTAFLWVLLGSIPLAGVWGYLNWQLYGNPLTLGYSTLYGPELRLGFHTDPWGRPFTPLVALSNAAVAVRRLHIYLFEWPIPALLPLGLWALVAKRRSTGDLVVAAGVLAAPLFYFFYWHSGFYPGPRFYYLSAPFLVIGSARAWCWAWSAARQRIRWGIRWDTALATAAAIVLVWSSVSLIPGRWSAYKAQLVTLKRNPVRELVQRSVSRALVLVPESWSSRVVTGLWSLGVPGGLAERAFARVGACELHHLNRIARADSLTGPEVIARVEDLMQHVHPPAARVPDWPDPALRLLPGRRVAAECRAEMERDLQGFTLYGPLAWRNPIGLDTGIVFARDRYDQNGRLLAHYEGWPIWRYAPPPGDPNGPPVLSGPLTAAALGLAEEP